MSASAPDPQRVDRMQSQMTNRRTFMKGVGVAAGAAVVGTGATSTALANEDDVYNPESEYSPRMRVVDTLTFGEHYREDAESVFFFTDDAGDQDDLGEYGASLAPREDADEDIEDPIPHNPITYRADNIEADAYDAFPRGETKEDADGDEVDVSALDAEEWSLDSGISATDKASPAGGEGVEFDADSATFTSPATATYDLPEPIDSGVARRRLFAVVSSITIGTGGSVTLRVVDGDGDTKDVDVPETDANVLQERIGDLSTTADGDGSFGAIEQVEFEFADADATVHVVGLDVEREGDLSFGEYEQYEDADEDSLETEEYEAPSGDVSITDIETLDSAFAKAKIVDLEVEAQLHMQDVPLSWIDVEFDAEEAEPYAEDYFADVVINLELPNPFDVSWGTPSVEDTIMHPSDRYDEVSTTTDDDKVTIARIDDDDEEFTWNDRTSRYDGDRDDDVTLESEVEPGQFVATHYVLKLRESEREDLMSGTAAAGGPVDARGGGIRAFIFSPIGAIVSALGLAGVGQLLAKKLGR